jgi:hypothetical protein
LKQSENTVWPISFLEVALPSGANMQKAQGCESRADFLHKIKMLTKKPKKPNTGWSYVFMMKIIRTRVICWKALPPFSGFPE